MIKDNMKKRIMQNSMSSSQQQQQQHDEPDDARVDRRVPHNIPQQHYKFMEQRRKAKEQTQLADDEAFQQVPSNNCDDTTDIERVGAFPVGGNWRRNVLYG